MGAGLVDKVIFLFPFHFWDITSDLLNFISDVPGEFPVIFNLYKYTSEPMLLLFVGGEKAVEYS